MDLRTLKELEDYKAMKESSRLYLQENGDHTLDLRQGKHTLARFSQTGVDILNIMREIEIGKYRS